MSKKIWICCSRCGSRDVTRDCLASWDEDNQRWENCGELDTTNCNSCDGNERRLDEVEIIPDHDIPEAIRKNGWFLNECEDGTFQVKWFHGDPDATGPFQELADAYLWSLYNDADEAEEKDEKRQVWFEALQASAGYWYVDKRTKDGGETIIHGEAVNLTKEAAEKIAATLNELQARTNP